MHVSSARDPLSATVNRRRMLLAVVLLTALVARGTLARAAIVYSQPLGETTQPVDDPRWNSTVQWQSVNGGGTIIGPHSFLSAQHLPLRLATRSR